MDNIVVIPVYKEALSDLEKISLRQCLYILGKHPVCLVVPEGLSLKEYKQIFDMQDVLFRYETFDPCFFTSVWAYNRLMLNLAFYQRFIDYEYMLIYQLDAYVFRDELDEWCQKGFDYIGAPWVKKDGTPDTENSGNGGLSLRRVARFIELFAEKGEVFGYKGLKTYHRFKHPLYGGLVVMAGLFHIGNRYPDYFKSSQVNEDVFYAALKEKKGSPFHVAPPEVARSFSFEKSPSCLFELNGYKLPFGCHAWEKWEYETFWKQYINRIV